MVTLGLSPQKQRLCLLILATFFTLGCTRKSQIQSEIDHANSALIELQIQSKKIEAEIMQVGSLGQYESTDKAHVELLKTYIKRLKADSERLNKELEVAKSNLELIQNKISDYRLKYN